MRHFNFDVNRAWNELRDFELEIDSIVRNADAITQILEGLQWDESNVISCNTMLYRKIFDEFVKLMANIPGTIIINMPIHKTHGKNIMLNNTWDIVLTGKGGIIFSYQMKIDVPFAKELNVNHLKMFCILLADNVKALEYDIIKLQNLRDEQIE
jgi:hypothetical protein